jgi:hypothetical protein
MGKANEFEFLFVFLFVFLFSSLNTVALNAEGVAAPTIEVSPTQMTADLLPDEIETQILTIGNTGGNDLVWEISRSPRDSTVLVMQAAAAEVVAGIIPSGTVEYDGVSRTVLSETERSLLLNRMIVYRQTMESLGAGIPLVGVSGNLGTDLSYHLLSNPELTGRYAFQILDYHLDGLTDLDGMVIAEHYTAFTEPGAAILRDFYDSGRGIFLGLERLSYVWNDNVPSLLGTVFGIYYPMFGNFCSDPVLNTNHAINQGISEFNLGENWCYSNNYFLPTTSDWLFMEGSTNHIFGVAHDGVGRTVLMGEPLNWIWAPNEQLNANALIWVIEGSFLPEVNPNSGVIPSGLNQIIDVTFDATDLCGGDFYSNLIVTSNDPLTPEVVVPTDMHVLGAPIAVLPDTLITFGEVFVGFSVIDTVTITNSGCDQLDINSITIDQGGFSTDTTPFIVPVDGTHYLPVQFNPGTEGPVTGTLTMTSNDPQLPLAQIILNGTGMNTPVIEVSPGQMAADLPQGGSETQVLTISNSGAGDLVYAIETERNVSAGQGSFQVSTGQLLKPVKTSGNAGGHKSGPVSAPAGQSSVGFADGYTPSRDPYPFPSETVPVASEVDLRLLLLGSGELDEIQAQLLAFSDITTVDIFDGENGTPTLTDLAAFNVVILANNFPYQNPEAVGDVLADYVDIGGGVIQTEASFVEGYNITGRFIDDSYAVFHLDTGPVGEAHLGTFDAYHPIMEGVTAAQCDLVSNTTLMPGAQWVADWDNGRTCVATNGNQVVGVNVFVAKNGYWSGDVDIILHNAAQWIVSRVAWLDVVPMAGTVSAGGSVGLLVTFNASGLTQGEYSALIHVNSNDPATPQFSVTVGLHIHDTLFTVDVDVTVGEASDLDNTLGIANGATDGFDGQFDLPEPPPAPVDYVTGYFSHPEWDSPLGNRFMTDIREPYDPGSDLKSWPFVVETDLDDAVTLTFTPSFPDTNGWELWLRDEATGGMHNLLPSLTYSFRPGTGANTFTILAGRIVPPLYPSERQVNAGWSMLGAPLVPPVGTNTWGDVLLDDATGTNVLLGYEEASGYGPVGGDDPVIQGQGVWLASTEAFPWTIQGNPDEETIHVAAMAGWNLVGYPLWIGGGLGGVSVDHDSQLYLWPDAVAAGLVSPFVYDYDGVTDTYLPVTSLEPWHGYWMVAHVNGITLQFNYRSMLGITHPVAAAPDGFDHRLPLLVQGARDDGQAVEKSGEPGWQLNVNLASTTDQVAFGRTTDATAGFDPAFDLPVPPSSPSSVEKATLVIRHPEWNLACGPGFYSDLVAMSVEPHQWNLTVAVPEPGPVTLSWDPLELPTEVDLQVYLPHENRVVVRSAREANSVQVEVGSAPVVVQFRTSNGITDVPGHLAGLQLRNVPNPFNPITDFRFNLPRTGVAEIRIFDLRGAVIKRITGGVMPAGPGTLRWAGHDKNGHEVASGIYFFRLYLDSRQEGPTLKMTLVK